MNDKLLAITPGDSFGPLIDEYQSYCARHNLPKSSADELYYSLLDKPEENRLHLIYLKCFLERWDIVCSA